MPLNIRHIIQTHCRQDIKNNDRKIKLKGEKKPKNDIVREICEAMNKKEDVKKKTEEELDENMECNYNWLPVQCAIVAV